MALRLTTAKYYTPSGVSIQDKGIEPHVVVNVTPTQEEQRRMQKYEEMEKALPENEGTKPDTETEKPLPESKKPLLSPDELETLTELPEEEEKEAFVDIQLREAVRILKAIKALGGGVTSPMAASAAR
jgi:carboxyl-terminal processing protease